MHWSGSIDFQHRFWQDAGSSSERCGKGAVAVSRRWRRRNEAFLGEFYMETVTFDRLREIIKSAEWHWIVRRPKFKGPTVMPVTEVLHDDDMITVVQNGRTLDRISAKDLRVEIVSGTRPYLIKVIGSYTYTVQRKKIDGGGMMEVAQEGIRARFVHFDAQAEHQNAVRLNDKLETVNGQEN
jgi:hypothetical protein